MPNYSISTGPPLATGQGPYRGNYAYLAITYWDSSADKNYVFEGVPCWVQTSEGDGHQRLVAGYTAWADTFNRLLGLRWNSANCYSIDQIRLSVLDSYGTYMGNPTQDWTQYDASPSALTRASDGSGGYYYTLTANQNTTQVNTARDGAVHLAPPVVNQADPQAYTSSFTADPAPTDPDNPGLPEDWDGEPVPLDPICPGPPGPVGPAAVPYPVPPDVPR